MSAAKTELDRAEQAVRRAVRNSVGYPSVPSRHLAPVLAEYDRRGEVEKAAAAYVMAGLCGNPSTSAELTALIAAVRTNGEFRG